VICKNGGADISKATTIFLFWGSLGFQNLPQSKYFFLMRRKAEKIVPIMWNKNTFFHKKKISNR
jgi:hypothetical protein